MCSRALLLPDGETECVQNSILASQSQMGTGIAATRSVLVRTVQILSFPV